MEQIPIRDEKLIIFYYNIEHDELMYIINPRKKHRNLKNMMLNINSNLSSNVIE